MTDDTNKNNGRGFSNEQNGKIRRVLGLLQTARPIIVYPEMAAEIGLLESIILQEISYWVSADDNESFRTKHFIQGRAWIFNSYDQWKKRLRGIFGKRSIQAAILNLEHQGLIVAKQLNKSSGNKTKWYTLPFVDEHHLPEFDTCPPIAQNMRDAPIAQNLPDHSAKFAPSTINKITYTQSTSIVDSLKSTKSEAQPIDPCVQNEHTPPAAKLAKSPWCQNDTRATDGFIEFYNAYGYKQKPREAKAAYEKALKSKHPITGKAVTHEMIMAGVQLAVTESLRDHGTLKHKYRPHPASWLNKGGYLSEDTSSASVSRLAARHQANTDFHKAEWAEIEAHRSKRTRSLDEPF